VSAPLLALRNVSQTYRENGQIVPAIENISFSAEAGQFISIIGPSGCGKSTLFNMIAGLSQPDEGEIRLHGRPLARRAGQFGYMPQKDLLLPWRTVLDNVILGPELAGQNRQNAREQAQSLLPLFGLEGFGQVYPSTLSGGMRQRAALLRTFLANREVMLLDEPFGALDALTRRELQIWLLDIWQKFKKTILFVTHDVEEALFLSDRVIVLSVRPGRVALDLPIGLPRPRSAEMMVSANFVKLKATLLTSLER
jgi:ABC-type nitrate/sulfonate/bicarbonate transport system ATPase subunit